MFRLFHIHSLGTEKMDVTYKCIVFRLLQIKWITKSVHANGTRNYGWFMPHCLSLVVKKALHWDTPPIWKLMMTSSNANIFRVTDPLCGEFTGHRWIPLTKASDARFDVFFDLRLKKLLNKQLVRLVIWDATAPIVTSLWCLVKEALRWDTPPMWELWSRRHYVEIPHRAISVGHEGITFGNPSNIRTLVREALRWYTPPISVGQEGITLDTPPIGELWSRRHYVDIHHQCQLVKKALRWDTPPMSLGQEGITMRYPTNVTWSRKHYVEIPHQCHLGKKALRWETPPMSLGQEGITLRDPTNVTWSRRHYVGTPLHYQNFGQGGITLRLGYPTNINW